MIKLINDLLVELDLTQEELGHKLGVKQSTVARWLRGADPRGTTRANLLELHASVFATHDLREVPLKGIVGAGQQVFPVENGDLEMVEAPPNATKHTVAASIEGESGLPALYPNWLIYWSVKLPPEDCINQLCVVHLADERILIKTLLPGSSAGLYNLMSFNASMMIDQIVESVSPIDWIKPR